MAAEAAEQQPYLLPKAWNKSSPKIKTFNSQPSGHKEKKRALGEVLKTAMAKNIFLVEQESKQLCVSVWSKRVTAGISVAAPIA